MSLGLDILGLEPLAAPGGAAAASGTTVTPDAGALAFSGYAPAISQSANQSVAPAAGALTFTGYAPTISQPQGVTPGAGSITLTGYAPAIAQTANQSMVPGTGSLAFSGYAPTVTQSSGQVVTPGVGGLAFTGYAPAIAQTSSMTVTPDAGTLSLTGYAPTLAQTANQWVNPGAGSLTFAGYAPTVAQALYVDPRYARPLSDVSAGPWAPSAGTSLAAMIDEPSADSSDFIQTASAGSCEIALNPVVDPGTSSGQVVRYQAWSPTGVGSLTVRLKQGATVIAEWPLDSLPPTPTIYAQALTGAQCDAITNYNDLRFEFVAA